MNIINDLIDEGRANHLIAVAKAFTDGKRPIPSYVLRQLWGLRPYWRSRKDVPVAVIEACKILDTIS
jgi:hypothetical protein